MVALVAASIWRRSPKHRQLLGWPRRLRRHQQENPTCSHAACPRPHHLPNSIPTQTRHFPARCNPHTRIAPRLRPHSPSTLCNEIGCRHPMSLLLGARSKQKVGLDACACGKLSMPCSWNHYYLPDPSPFSCRYQVSLLWYNFFPFWAIFPAPHDGHAKQTTTRGLYGTQWQRPR